MTESAPQRKRASRDDMRWYKRDPSRVLAGILGLSNDQKLVYLLVIELLYETRGPLPASEDVRIAGRLGLDIRMFRRVVGELLEIDRLKTDEAGEFLWDERAIRVLVRADLVSERQSRRGKKGNAARWGSKPKPRNVTPQIGLTLPASLPAKLSLKKTGTANENNGPRIAIREGEGESRSEPTTSSARAARRREALEALNSIKQPKGKDETEEAERPAPADRTARRRKA